MTKFSFGQCTKMALFGAAVALPLALASQQASATAIAYSAISVDNFLLTNNFGGFTSFQFISRAINSNLNGVDASRGQQSCNTSGCAVDINQLTQGLTPWAANNSYSGANAPTLANAQAGDFTVGDSHMTNTVILTGDGGTFGAQSGAGVSGGVGGSSATGANNKMFWNFSAVAGTTLNFSFDYALDLFAETTELLETAGNGVSFKVQLTDATGGNVLQQITYFNTQPGISANFSPLSYDLSESGSEADSFFISTAGQFGFNIIFDTSADAASQVATNVPEPGTLAVLGLGILGLGAARFRRKAF